MFHDDLQPEILCAAIRGLRAQQGGGYGGVLCTYGYCGSTRSENVPCCGHCQREIQSKTDSIGKIKNEADEKSVQIDALLQKQKELSESKKVLMEENKNEVQTLNSLNSSLSSDLAEAQDEIEKNKNEII